MAELLENLIRTLKRRMLFIFGITFFGFMLTAFYIQNIQPLYTATAQIIFDGQDPAFIKTQETRIKSSQIISPVIKTFGLADNPYYSGNHMLFKKDTPFKTLNPRAPSNDGAQKLDDKALHQFLKLLDTHFIPDTYVLNVSYTTHNPYLAAKIVNMLAKTYIGSLPVEKEDIYIAEQIQRKLDFLQQDIDNAYADLENFRAFQQRSKPPLLIKTHTTQINEEARLEYARAKAALTPFMDKSGVMIMNDRAPAILSATSIQKLKFESRGIEEQLKTLSQRYGPKHPEIIALTKEFKTLHDKIDQEKSNIMAKVKSDYDRAKAKVESLANTSTSFVNKTQSLFSNAAQQNIDLLKEKVEKAIQNYKDYQTNIEQKQLEQTTTNKAAKLLEEAHAPLLPSFPRKTKILGYGTAISFIIALLLTILFEKSRNGFLSGRQLEDALGVPCYALIPNAQKQKGTPLGNYVLDNPASQIAEAVRSLRLTLRLREDAAQNTENKVITITSSFPDEGKTTLCAWLGRLAAKSGERVILIDADLRRPSQHKIFNHKNTLSLVEYLSGTNKLEEVINTSDPSGLHIMYGRSVPNSALDLLSSDRMDDLIRSLRKAYDLIIIDSPASMAVADARALNKLSDHLLYVVRWNKTPREIVHNGIMQFLKFGKPRIATVLTNINLKKHVQFGYGGAVNYIGHYKEYYNA